MTGGRPRSLSGRPRLRWVLLGASSLMLGGGCQISSHSAPPAAPREVAPTDLSGRLVGAEALLVRSNYEQAAQEFRAVLAALGSVPRTAFRERAELGLARTLSKQGRVGEALHLLAGASSRSFGLERAELHWSLRALAKARAELTPLLESSELELPLRARATLLLGRIELESGARDRGHVALERVLAMEAQGQAELLWLQGRAAFLLRRPAVALAAYQKAEELGLATPEFFASWAELFLEGHDVIEARRALRAALERSPEDPDLLALWATLLLRESLAFEEAEQAAASALRVHSHHPEALGVLIEIRLREQDYVEAGRLLEEALRVHPEHPQIWELVSVERFVSEDAPGFEDALERTLELAPGRTRVFDRVSELAEWEHRYAEMELLLRRAVRLDRQDGRLRGRLGLTLVRAGSDAAGIVELRRAFELDPYNARVYNTLELYERLLPRDYVEERQGRFLYRFPKNDAPLLRRYVPRLAEEAYGAMVARYDYEPKPGVFIEIYATAEEFAVRTSGLPTVGIQGVCFGQKLATVSPSSSPANLGMTLWHELAHVFHLGMSESRVPRWLTEGLAEWETAALGRGWGRELDRKLAAALRADRVPNVARMNRAFTHSRSLEGVATAYFTAGRLATWMMQRDGLSVPTLLRALGPGRLTQEVLAEHLGEMERVDRDFRAWLTADLERFDSQFLSIWPVEPLPELEEQARTQPSRASRRAWALGLVRDGHEERAAPLLQELFYEESEPAVGLPWAEILRRRGDRQGAREALLRAVAWGPDGVELELALARGAVADKQWAEALEHLNRARGFDPEEPEIWVLLATVAGQQGNADLEFEALERWANFDEAEPRVHERVVLELLERGRIAAAAQAAERLVWVGLFRSESHRVVARAFRAVGRLQEASFEEETARWLIDRGR